MTVSGEMRRKRGEIRRVEEKRNRRKNKSIKEVKGSREIREKKGEEKRNET